MCDEYDSYGDDSFNPEDFDPQDTGYNYKSLYFLGGDYKIELINELVTSADSSYCTFYVTKTNINGNSKKSLFDVFSIFEESFFLEFLVSLMTYHVLNIGSLKKIISLAENHDPCICITGSFSANQKYLHCEDINESDECATDIFTMNENQVMRTHQYFYSPTQAAKYVILKYDIIHKGRHNWDSIGIDWYAMYKSLIEPYILFMMTNALKCPVDSIMQHKEYMTFNCQISSSKSGNSFYSEIYLLPSTVHGRKIIYNNEFGREILIGVDTEDENQITTDQYRVCMGSQNLNLLPINTLNLKHTIDGGKEFIVGNELSLEDDSLMNYFALVPDRYSSVPKEFTMYLKPINGIEPCKFNLQIAENKAIESMFNFFAFSGERAKYSVIELASDTRLYGVVTFALSEKIAPNMYSSTIIENNDYSFLPQMFYKIISENYKLPDDTKFILLPIRALPQYREFMLISIIHDSNPDESQSDIISKSESENNNPSNKKGFFSSLFEKKMR